jgi:hypothetical protein
VSARHALTKSNLTQKLRRYNVKLYLQIVQRTTRGVRRKKHTQCHIVQEEQLSRVRTVARCAQG